ncbi:glycoside hydrolase domain-containing protein [Mucilaginibacter boryungensis]|uniref:Glycoside hydrolase family 92 protein n=1 Tax=Mucilaginibacter boryungensis TaxID=768480 RepID=A0ABR9XH93_9SPHI|nr:glycoside hydrolase domain-containing protein [Mucilaginibacter boryungensis]MBE9666762.1 glycoside hydrolase family 92 protein [Mucilaginibacter boryungensis]
MKTNHYYLSIIFTLSLNLADAQHATGTKGNPTPDLSANVNVFLGTSGDHGQMSPAASYPLSMLSIGPQTYPNTHTGYEYEAKRFLGFTHNRMEGVGCRGSGGNILIKPFVGEDVDKDLIKIAQSGSPGYYKVSFTNKVIAEMTAGQKTGMHRYTFPAGNSGYYIDLAHTLANKFVAEEHVTTGNTLSGWVEARTTCSVGTYKIYYYIEFSQLIQWKDKPKHKLVGTFTAASAPAEIRVGMSSVNTGYARSSIFRGTFDQLRKDTRDAWNTMLGRFTVTGAPDRTRLFYSLLYRTLQSPYQISESDGVFRGTDGKVDKSTEVRYNGWAVWDNYRTQLPLLSVAWPEKYSGMVSSLASLYISGKQDYATQTEPTNTVRTEHTIVVLLDAYRKGYPVKFDKIIDSLIREVDHLDFSKPDKALESSYDTWALSEILTIIKKDDLSEKYRLKALEYKKYWEKDFKNMKANDVDRIPARDLYQGTIWQYRWFVPFDVRGLIGLTGDMPAFTAQLDQFFGDDLYNHANEPDLQAPLMFNAAGQPWKSQELMHRFAADTVIQYYFNDNSKGIDPFVDRVYKNEPKAYIRTMDDDAGAMSAWYVLAACGFSPACPGWPVYYLNVPLMKTVKLHLQDGKTFEIEVENSAPNYKYIQKATLNGKILRRNYITHQEISAGGKLTITASPVPVMDALPETWTSQLENK